MTSIRLENGTNPGTYFETDVFHQQTTNFTEDELNAFKQSIFFMEIGGGSGTTPERILSDGVLSVRDSGDSDVSNDTAENFLNPFDFTQTNFSSHVEEANLEWWFTTEQITLFSLPDGHSYVSIANNVVGYEFNNPSDSTPINILGYEITLSRSTSDANNPSGEIKKIFIPFGDQDLSSINWSDDPDGPAIIGSTTTELTDSVLGQASDTDFSSVDGSTYVVYADAYHQHPKNGISDYIVSGTDGDDLIDAAYTGDAEGDLIDNDDGNPNSPGAGNDDFVLAGAGDDTIHAGAGDDTVYGGTGNDLIVGDDTFEGSGSSSGDFSSVYGFDAQTVTQEYLENIDIKIDNHSDHNTSDVEYHVNNEGVVSMYTTAFRLSGDPLTNLNGQTLSHAGWISITDGQPRLLDQSINHQGNGNSVWGGNNADSMPILVNGNSYSVVMNSQPGDYDTQYYQNASLTFGDGTTATMSQIGSYFASNYGSPNGAQSNVLYLTVAINDADPNDYIAFLNSPSTHGDEAIQAYAKDHGGLTSIDITSSAGYTNSGSINNDIDMRVEASDDPSLAAVVPASTDPLIATYANQGDQLASWTGIESDAVTVNTTLFSMAGTSGNLTGQTLTATGHGIIQEAGPTLSHDLDSGEQYTINGELYTAVGPFGAYDNFSLTMGDGNTYSYSDYQAWVNANIGTGIDYRLEIYVGQNAADTSQYVSILGTHGTNASDDALARFAEAHDGVVSLTNLNLASIGGHVDLKHDGFGVVKVSGVDMPTEANKAPGNDLLYGNEGDDTIMGRQGDDTLFGGTGADSLSGDEGADVIDAGDGDDSVYGGSGNDTIEGGAGNDLIYGSDSENTDSSGGATDVPLDELLAGIKTDGITDLETLTFNIGQQGNNGFNVVGNSFDLSDPMAATLTMSDDNNDTLYAPSESGDAVFVDGEEVSLLTNGSSTNVFQGSIIRSITTADGTTYTQAEIDAFALEIAQELDPTVTQANQPVITHFYHLADNGDMLVTLVPDGNAGSGSNVPGFVYLAAFQQKFGAIASMNVDNSGQGFMLYDTVPHLPLSLDSTGNDDDSLSGGAGDDTIYGNHGDDTIDGGADNDQIIGGAGSDILTGGDGDDVFVFDNDGADVITDFGTGNSGPITDGDKTNNDYVDLSEYYTDQDELHADFLDDGILNQSTGDFTDNTAMADGASLEIQGITTSDLRFETTNVPCFTAGTLIKTIDGQKPVDQLRQGDLVWTKDAGYQPIRWISHKTFSDDALRQNENLRPIRIAAGAMGFGMPNRDLIVSQQHRVLVNSKIAERMTSEAEVLVSAKHLLRIRGIDVLKRLSEVTYVHFMFDRHHVVEAEGILTESLYTGPEALKSLSAEAREEIFAIFPELMDAQSPAPTPARKFLSGRQARKLAQRQIQNKKPLLQPTIH